MTGGTVLSVFYLKHRVSEDLDFFSEKKEVEPVLIDAFLKKISPILRIKEIKRTQFLGLFTYFLVYKDGKSLKVDFNYYPFPRIEKGKKYKSLRIASLYDIAVDKLHTLFMKPRARDYIDLFFILKERKDYSISKLILDAKTKFDWNIDYIELGSQFLRVKDFEEFPKMLRSFNREEMERFFINEAKKLKREILR